MSLFQTYESFVLFWGLFAGAVSWGVARLLKKQLETAQYVYIRDLLLMGAWMLLTIWLGSPQTRLLVGLAVLAGIIGIAQELWESALWNLSFLAIGLIASLSGTSIKFISFMDGEYIFLSKTVEMMATSFWFFIFPVILRWTDDIPGLVGHMLGVCFVLMLMAVSLSSQALGDAFFMSFTGLALLGAFWSRYGHAHRNAGGSMCALWGTLVAGTSILGVGKGIAFSALLFLPVGLFAIPMFEVSLNLVHPSQSRDHYYRKLVSSGFDHLASVRVITLLCALVGMGVGAWQLQNSLAASVLIAVAAAIILITIIPFALQRGSVSKIPDKHPVLWGVPIDNVSLNYALSRVKGEVQNLEKAETCGIVATVNALALETAVVDKEYKEILQDTILTLADGTGLLWALRFLGYTVQERVAGIDFAEQLCKIASVNDWGVYFLGASGDTAERAADALAGKFPGLRVVGARDGYFDFNDARAAREIADAGAQILFVAMGLPRQEKWLMQHGHILKNCIAVGVGGSFDVFAGKLRRAPVWMQKCGLEWLYRLLQQPWRLRRMLGLPVFVVRVFMTRLGLYKNR